MASGFVWFRQVGVGLIEVGVWLIEVGVGLIEVSVGLGQIRIGLRLDCGIDFVAVAAYFAEKRA